MSCIASAMERGRSRLVIQEIIVPELGADVEASWMDLTMMSIAGTQRTEKHWSRLLDAAGLRLSRTFTVPGNSNGVIEALLKEDPAHHG